MNWNNLSIEVYDSGTTLLTEVMGEMRKAQDIEFTTGYPGGLYMSASLMVPRRVVEYWALRGGKRIVFRNGMKIVWEGKIDDIDSLLGVTNESIKVGAIGFWGGMLNRRRWQKRWADNRMSDDIWVWDIAATAVDKCTLDRTNQLKFVPKNVQWALNDQAAVIYTMPTGETIKRITFNYGMLEYVDMTFALFNGSGGAEWAVYTTATGSADVTFGTPTQTAKFALKNTGGIATPPADGTHYAFVNSVMVYSETGDINLTEIVKDVRDELSLTGDLAIASNPSAIAPFYADSWETVAATINKAASYGDSLYNPWAVGVLDSEYSATTPNGNPVLYCEQVPVLTDYDYAVRLDEQNLASQISVNRDHSQIWNWIVVEYDEAGGRKLFITPDDDASLKDTVSIADYGQRDHVIKCPAGSVTTATAMGRRVLREFKDPKYTIQGQLAVNGYIRNKNGNITPACEIRAGKRLRIENFLPDLSGTGLTFLLTQTNYNDNDETCSLQTGVLDKLSVYLARLSSGKGIWEYG